jgi:PAS domain S-box-containing protein
MSPLRRLAEAGRSPPSGLSVAPPRFHPRPVRFAAAAGAFAASLLARRLLLPFVGESVPFLFYFPAIIFSSWYGGMSAGLLCTALSVGAALCLSSAGGFGALTSADGARVAIFAAIGVFISALNQQLHRTAASLSASVRLTTEILEAMGDAFYLLDGEGRFKYVNRSAERIWGRKRTDLLGKPLQSVFPELIGSETFGALERAMKQRTPQRVEARSPVLGRWIDADIRPVEDGVTVYFRDISDRKKLEQELLSRVERRTERLNEVNAELDSFTYSASHDLRAPVRKIQSYCDLIDKSAAGGLPAETRRYFERVCSSAERLQRILDEMLNLANATQHEIRRERLSVSRLAEELLAEKRESDPARRVETAVAPGLEADADPNLLWVVLHNLIDNAWKFTAFREDARIEVGSAASPAGRAFFVRDNGAGFDMAHSSKLFKAFERLHETDEYPGAGVGLAIAQRVVRRHGGEIWADSRPGEGAAFYFTIPGAP